jgi:hypothetical protein
MNCGGAGPVGGRRAKAGEDRVANALARLLDDDYYLLRNVPLPDDPYDLDMVLVGPTGVWEFEILHFQRLVNTDEGWVHWDFNQQTPQPIPAVLISRTQEKVTQLRQFLARNGILEVEINQANILSTPNAPRDFTLPGLQVVFLDELEGFVRTAASLFTASQPVPVAKLVELLNPHLASQGATAPVSPRLMLLLGLAVVCVLGVLLAVGLYAYFNFM